MLARIPKGIATNTSAIANNEKKVVILTCQFISALMEQNLTLTLSRLILQSLYSQKESRIWNTYFSGNPFMKRKKQMNTGSKPSGSYEHLGAESDFYTGGAPSEQPLYQDRHQSSNTRVRKTGRHQAVAGRRKEAVDMREKMALLAILKTGVMIILLVIAFFLLRQGISIYEQSLFVKTQGEETTSPVLQEVLPVEGFDINDQNSREMFAERIEVWKEASRLVRSAEGLLKRDNLDLAIERCQDALRLDPSHMGALEHLGRLYYQKGMNVEAINSYIRLISVDPSREDLQEKLIQALDAYEDSDAVSYMSRWYLEQNEYNENVQRYLANALFRNEEYAEAAKEYSRVLKDDPTDLESLEQQTKAYMFLEEYENALESLNVLREQNYREQSYYRQIAICNAQLGNGLETVQTLGKAAHLFGQNLVMGWVQDPKLDPVREDRTFQAFAERVGGEEFRKWLEKVAKTMDGEQKKDITPQLSLPKDGALDSELLKVKK
ncbi:tetratricopeptide repeat protein [Pontiellaceae bacterium B12227]|nr:tetratricopeptide repeat protein [Pontiellaceae bacterium B12227]